MHIIWAEDSWINYSIRGLEDLRRPFPFKDYQSWEAIIDYNDKVVAQVNEYLSELAEPELGRKVWRV
ncbi:MAG: DinB family protein, partial [Nitrososphaera sp.]